MLLDSNMQFLTLFLVLLGSEIAWSHSSSSSGSSSGSSSEERNGVCSMGENLYRNNQRWLDTDCSNYFTCRNGVAIPREFSCPPGSECKRGKCRCINLSAAEVRNRYRILVRCKVNNRRRVNNRGAKSCKVCGKRYKDDQKWMNRACTYSYKCDNGKIIPTKKSCPANSKCRRGKCVCNKGYKVDQRDNGGTVSCKPKNVICISRGKKFPDKKSWLSPSCKRKFFCNSGSTTASSYACPANSECKFGGTCRCYKGFRSVRGPDRRVKSCTMPKRMACRKGFERLYGKCLAIKKYAKVDYFTAKKSCRQMGGQLFVPDDLFGFLQFLKKDKWAKGRGCFIGGAPELSVSSLRRVKKSIVRKFLLSTIKKFKCRSRLQYKTFRRFSGKCNFRDLNYRSPMSSFCLNYDFLNTQRPSFSRCFNKMGYICEQTQSKGGLIRWSQWYNLNTDNRRGDVESIYRVTRKLNRNPRNNVRMCRKPVAMECRDSVTKKSFSVLVKNGLKLRGGCKNNRILCRNKDQRDGKVCPDFEVRFRCPVDDADTCKVRQVVRACQLKGMKCVDRSNGATCVKKRRVKNKKEKINTGHCTANGKSHELYMCKASGDPHYTTLDGWKFNFQGVCSYNFVSTITSFIGTEDFPAFSIVSKNYKKSPDNTVSWTKSFALSIGSSTYTFLQGKFYVTNGLTIESNPVGYCNEQLKITAESKGKSTKLVIETNFCLRIVWDNVHSLTVYVPEYYMNKVTGLCGNFDGNCANDLTVYGTPKRMTATQIGEAFLISGPESNVCKREVPEPAPCSAEDLHKYQQPEYCGIFDINSQSPLVREVLNGSDSSSRGVNTLSLNNEFQECIEDLCWDKTTDRCHDLEDVIEEIRSKLCLHGEPLDTDWRDFAKCEKTEETRCAEKPNMVYSTSYVAICQNTCYEPDKEDNCDEEEVTSGCICATGFYLDSKLNCVPIQQCDLSCTFNTVNGETVQIEDGEDYVAVPCQMMAVCNKGKIDNKPMTHCSEHADCMEYGKKCICRHGYIGNGYYCESQKNCRRGYLPFGDKCYKYVPDHKDWHAAAINCGADGSQLARYDDEGDQELNNFIKKMPEIHAKTTAQRRNVFCSIGSLCSMPCGHLGVHIRLNDPADESICEGKYMLAPDGKSIIVNGTCKAIFVVTLIKDITVPEYPKEFNLWIGGNSHIISQTKRIDEAPFQVDPPRMVDFGSYQNPTGCFQAQRNEDDTLIVEPVQRCWTRQASVCEYDNIGHLPYDPLDFKGIKVKVNYEEALHLCSKLDRPLAIITNKKQQQRVREILAHFGGDGWIGAQYNTDGKKFLWSDETELTFKMWKEGEPSGSTIEEHCVSVDSVKGEWSSDDCDDLFYPVCGLSTNVEAAVYTRYFDIAVVRSLNELRHQLANSGDHTYVCERPFAIECSAQLNATGEWVTNLDQSGSTLFCTADSFHCQTGEEFNCETFRIRFFCPVEDNQCASLSNISVTACDAGRLCLPVRNHYVCRCPNNKRFNERTQACQKKCGTCMSYGDPHYKTLKGRFYEFMGNCMYKFSGMCPLAEFATEPNFDVYTKNRVCFAPDMSCLDSIEIHLRNIRVWYDRLVLKKDFVFKVYRDTPTYVLNDNEISQSLLEKRGAFKAKFRTGFFNIYVDSMDLSILYTSGKVIISVSDVYYGKMCGLCGDCSTEEFQMRNGSMVSVPETSYRYNKTLIIPVANEWLVDYDQYRDNETHCKSVVPADECTHDVAAKLEAKDMCGIFNDTYGCLSKCFSVVNSGDFYRSCIVDSCHAGDVRETVCMSIKSYAQSCLEMGVIMNWRRADFCPYECEDKEYRSDASCQQTCGKSDVVGNNCDEDPEEGCVCPSGLVRDGEKCVHPNQCGCDVILNNEGDTWHLLPGESVLLPGCLVTTYCEVLGDGSSEDIRLPFPMDPNAICKEGPPPHIECVKGYEMDADNITCNKLPKECSRGYENLADMCVKVCDGVKIWRQAIEACNMKDGTLAFIDTVDKVSEVKELMLNGSYDQVFISGQVRVSMSGGVLSFNPILDETRAGKIEYYNFKYDLPESFKVELSDTLQPFEVVNGTVLALVAKLKSDGSIAIMAVPRDAPANFLCEERDVPEEVKVWFGPCNSDSVMKDGDLETHDSLMDSGCLVCPVPMEIKCDKVPNAAGNVSGECHMTRSGNYYKCDQGTDCIDHHISTKCAPDANECDEQLDDCPGRSVCVNTVGAYICKCNEYYPVMIRGQCHGISQCAMTGPKTNDDYVFEFNGFQGSKGYFDYECQFLIGGICQKQYNNDTGLPYIEIYSMSAITPNGLEPALAGYIFDPVSNSERRFAIDPTLLTEGKIMFGKTEGTMQKRSLGFVHEGTNTYFSPLTGDVLIIRHLDSFFKLTISFPMEVTLEMADVYNDILCGVCIVPPTVDEGFILLTDEERILISADPEVPCERNIPTTTPEATTMTTTTTTTTTTTPEQTTTPPDEQCEMAVVCSALGELCSTSRQDCVRRVCGAGQDICLYLELNTFSNCAEADIMQQFISDLQCDNKICKPNMRFAYSQSLIPRSCQYPDGNFDTQESSRPENVFNCICSEGFILSGSSCIPFDDCGCVGNDGIYFERGESWNNDICTVTSYCEGGNRITNHPYKCHAQAKCVRDVKGYVCDCIQGYYGNGDGEVEEGCVPAVVEEGGSKLCFNVYALGVLEKKCFCNFGYASNCFQCADIDECATGLHHCDRNTQKCVNMPGTYMCECAEGLQLEAGKCVRVFKERLCESMGPEEKVVNFEEEDENGMKCVAGEKIIKTCENLICDGGPQACCKAASKETVQIMMSCYHTDGTLSHSKEKVFYQAGRCKCQDGDDK